MGGLLVLALKYDDQLGHLQSLNGTGAGGVVLSHHMQHLDWSGFVIVEGLTNGEEVPGDHA